MRAMIRVVAVVLVMSGVACAQVKVPSQPEVARAIAGGGIKAPGWTGRIDTNAMKQGQTINDDRFVEDGNSYAVTTGPTVTYWNPANEVSGDYTGFGDVYRAKIHGPEYASSPVWDRDCGE